MEETKSKETESQSRRDLFRTMFKKTGEVALKQAEHQVKQAARRFVRPPGAETELEFLAACTRCGDCVPACPHGTIFLLDTHTGIAMNTPALDLTNKACHLCKNFPCIATCEPNALKPVDPETLRFAKVRINSSTCLPFQGPECGVCVSVCPLPGAITFNLTIPQINPDVCNGCAACREACLVAPPAITVHPLDIE